MVLARLAALPATGAREPEGCNSGRVNQPAMLSLAARLRPLAILS